MNNKYKQKRKHKETKETNIYIKPKNTTTTHEQQTIKQTTKGNNHIRKHKTKQIRNTNKRNTNKTTENTQN